jgi:hypothetical protein
LAVCGTAEDRRSFRSGLPVQGDEPGVGFEALPASPEAGEEGTAVLALPSEATCRGSDGEVLWRQQKIA